jgi:1-acyl-sn-glycerol-3-phosphate acyltransferase
MRIIRGFIVLIQMIIFALGALCIGLFIIPISAIFLKKVSHRRFCANVIHKSWKLFTIVMQKFGSIKVETQGDFKDIKGKVIVASHPSLIDIVLLIGLIPNSLCLAKKELLKNPVMYKIVKCLYIINDIDLDEFQAETKKALENNFNIIIFPTGTRTLPNEEIKLHKGAAQIAINANVDIIPIAIDTDYSLLRKNHFPLDCGTKTTLSKVTKKDIIKNSEFKQQDCYEIKLRKIICEKIKEEIFTK